MCGICGILRISSEPIDPDGRLLDRMTDSLTHRGPNDRGVWSDGRIALGNRRLAVIDLSTAGHQPMVSDDGAVRITYNGEVYNFRELSRRHRLAERGYIFHSSTDTEVLLHLYEAIGPAMLAELDGMFALAIWDGRENRLHLARDRFGIKPLFYQRDDHHLRFGSEIKSLLTDPRVPRRASLQALHDYLSFDYIPGPQTAFEGVLEVPPGHCMTIQSDGRARLERFWNPALEIDESIDERSAVNRSRELLDQAVHRQLVADVPVGVLLSGGLDSSAIVACMTPHTREPIHTYAIGFNDRSFDERSAARTVAAHFQTRHREVVITADIVRTLLPIYLRSIDEPYADGSAIPTYVVSELAAQDVVVLLSGEGGDEVFGGYDTYTAYKVAEWARRVPRWLRQRLATPLIQRLPVSHSKLSLEFRLKRFLGGLDLPPAQAHLWWRIVLTEAEKTALYSPRVLQELQPEPSALHIQRALELSPGADPLAGLMLADTLVFLPDDLMVKNDRMTMAHSLEARVPMTDLDLTGFLRTVPSHLKMPGLTKKNLLRGAMAGQLPPAVLNKKKMGLEMPYSRWLKHELRDVLLRYCSRERVEATGLFRATAVQLLVDEHLNGARDNGRALWGLVNYMLWHELYSVS
ncbi:MAG: asparagine synthase (glutamine-hydrolyzing) [Chloroflexota bacterium]